MEEIKKIKYYSELYHYYHSLLTDKQRLYFEMYYDKDYSLSEIGDFYSVTRQAVYDQIRIALSKLEESEEKMGLLKKSNLRKEYIKNMLETKDEIWLKKLMEMEE